jgi:hypothetical protein
MITIINNINAVSGRFNRLKRGPRSAKIIPRIDEIKNLGNFSIFSQKSDIIHLCYVDWGPFQVFSVNGYTTCCWFLEFKLIRVYIWMSLCLHHGKL